MFYSTTVKVITQLIFTKSQEFNKETASKEFINFVVACIGITRCALLLGISIEKLRKRTSKIKVFNKTTLNNAVVRGFQNINIRSYAASLFLSKTKPDKNWWNEYAKSVNADVVTVVNILSKASTQKNDTIINNDGFKIAPEWIKIFEKLAMQKYISTKNVKEFADRVGINPRLMRKKIISFGIKITTEHLEYSKKKEISFNKEIVQKIKSGFKNILL